MFKNPYLFLVLGIVCILFGVYSLYDSIKNPVDTTQIYNVNFLNKLRAYFAIFFGCAMLYVFFFR